MLNNDASDAGIEALMARLMAAGVTPYQSGEVAFLAVDNVCPRWEPALVAWAHKVTAPVSPVYSASEKVGGVIR